MSIPLLDRVPGDDALYIGGLFTLRGKEALAAAHITAVLSVLRQPLDAQLFRAFTHLVVEVDDVDDENLLQHFPACCDFIHDALNGGGAVLVHCAMGKSRSVTCVCAYLIRRYRITPGEALARIRESRPLAEPNDGFWEQLKLWYDMGAPEDIGGAPAYQRWLYQQEVALSRACGQAPDADKIRFEDEHAPEASAADFDLRCRKCRRTLATSQYLVKHEQRPDANSSAGDSPAPCSHYFLDPLSWMRPELEQGKLDGRLECPKCRTNVGKYAWQGMQCSCGEWIVPGISLARGRIDQARSRPQHQHQHQQPSKPGIRMPPSTGSRKPDGNL